VSSRSPILAEAVYLSSSERDRLVLLAAASALLAAAELPRLSGAVLPQRSRV